MRSCRASRPAPTAADRGTILATGSRSQLPCRASRSHLQSLCYDGMQRVSILGTYGTASAGYSSCRVLPRKPCARSSGVEAPAPNAVEAPAPDAQAPAPALQTLELHPFINNQGMVIPPQAPSASGGPSQAWVLAVYDSNQKLQYVGFSRDLRNTLRTLLGRRPDKAHYYKAYGLPELDQEAMLNVRDQWFQEVGGAPTGNKLQLERTLWQSPVDGGAISSRGKLAAAEDTARNIVASLQLRGLKEKFVANPALLENGQVDFLPSEDLSEEERQKLIEAQQAAAASTRNVHTVIDGQERTFQLRSSNVVQTRGGYMMDVVVTLDNRETQHRIIVGKQYVEAVGLTSPDPAAEAAMAVLLAEKQPRHTEGVMPVGQFPVNYFTVSEVEQWWDEDFRQAFKIAAGRELERDGLLGHGVAWRWTRRHAYGAGFMEDLQRKQTEGARSALGQRTSRFIYE